MRGCGEALGAGGAVYGRNRLAVEFILLISLAAQAVLCFCTMKKGMRRQQHCFCLMPAALSNTSWDSRRAAAGWRALLLRHAAASRAPRTPVHGREGQTRLAAFSVCGWEVQTRGEAQLGGERQGRRGRPEVWSTAAAAQGPAVERGEERKREEGERRGEMWLTSGPHRHVASTSAKPVTKPPDGRK